jgi:valyl-tRNA synthetase
MHVLAGLLFHSVAFKQVLANGLILDKQGHKMSKRLGNAVDPFAIMDQHEPDALRREGIARELVNRLQNLRKEQGLAVPDKIKISLAPGHLFVREAVQQHEAYICYETQALQLDIVDEMATGALLNLDGYDASVLIAKHPAACQLHG